MRLQSLLDDFATLGSWTLRFSHLTDLGTLLPPLNPEARTEAAFVPGCSSPLWFTVRASGGILAIAGHSPGLIPRGLAGTLAFLFHEATVADTQAFFQAQPADSLGGCLGFPGNLSPSRQATFSRLLARIPAATEAHP